MPQSLNKKTKEVAKFTLEGTVRTKWLRFLSTEFLFIPRVDNRGYLPLNRKIKQRKEPKFTLELLVDGEIFTVTSGIA